MDQRTFIKMAWLLCLAAGLGFYSATGVADDVRVAVASNFSGALEELARQFEAESGHRLVASAGSTGKHYAQIVNGAPYEVYLAADSARPRALEASGRVIPASRFTYAVGELILWSSRPGLALEDGQVLESGAFRFLAMANPELAPYGRAAREFLYAIGLWENIRAQIVMGENISQAFHFAYSGNADLGLIARSQLAASPRKGDFWQVPPQLYTRIEQQGVLLRDTVAARRFLAFMQSEKALRIIETFGYQRP